MIDTVPIRTVACECLPGYQGDALDKCIPSRPSLCVGSEGREGEGDGGRRAREMEGGGRGRWRESGREVRGDEGTLTTKREGKDNDSLTLTDGRVERGILNHFTND